MRYFKAVIEYDGTNYSGWQRQKNTSMTIQQKVEEALSKIEKKSVSVLASGRTDAGVHAYGQVIGFSLANSIPTSKIPIATNGLLPRDIRIIRAEEVDKDFHPRYQTKGKIYQYKIETGSVQSVFRRNYTYYYPFELDIQKIRESIQHLVGTNDFSSFRASGCSAKSPVRTIKKITVSKNENLYMLEYEGDGFLYNMVRILTGTLLQVGIGKFDPIEVKEILEAKDRNLAGPTVPGHGLYLKKVFY